MNNFIIAIIVIVIISTVVGAVAKLLNSLNEMNAARGNPPAGGANRAVPRANPNAGAGARQGNADMDRFLAEIDRLRRKNAEAPQPVPTNQAPVAPVVQPARQPDRPRPRVVAEVVEAPREDRGFASQETSQAGQSGQAVHQTVDLPVAAVVTPPSGTGAPATRVTRFSGRPRPVAKTPFAKNLTSLLNSGHGLALAIVLQEILGPPKSKQE